MHIIDDNTPGRRFFQRFDDGSLFSVPPIQTTPILSPGQTISGTLTTSDETDPFFADIGVFYKDDFELSGVSADQSVTVEMNSVDFDSFLDLVDADNNILLDFDDDGTGSLNSRITFTVQPNIRYLIRATSASAEETGNYEIHMVVN